MTSERDDAPRHRHCPGTQRDVHRYRWAALNPSLASRITTLDPRQTLGSRRYNSNNSPSGRRWSISGSYSIHLIVNVLKQFALFSSVSFSLPLLFYPGVHRCRQIYRWKEKEREKEGEKGGGGEEVLAISSVDSHYSSHIFLARTLIVLAEWNISELKYHHL